MNSGLKKRIIACLDIIDGRVVKGVQFQNHEDLGDCIEFAKKYEAEGVDELVLYDIVASPRGVCADLNLVSEIAKNISIPFCVAGGIRSVAEAEMILASGADKISINSPALENPKLITEIAKRFGTQCVVVGIDSRFDAVFNNFCVYQYTGDATKTIKTKRLTYEWVVEVCELGAGEIVLNCIDSDGMRAGYDLEQTSTVADLVSIPVVASGGAGKREDFLQLFTQTKATGGLAASIFHKNAVKIPLLKSFLYANNVLVRL